MTEENREMLNHDMGIYNNFVSGGGKKICSLEVHPDDNYAMFDMPIDSFFKDLKPATRDYVISDNDIYVKIRGVILKYCNSKKLVLSNVPTLVGDTYDPANNANILIYTIYPNNHGRAISDLINLNFERWVVMKTLIENEHIIIEYDTRIVADLRSVKQHPKIRLYELLSPVVIDTPIVGLKSKAIKKPIMYISPEMEAIKIYQDLYSPDKFKEWESLMNYEGKLFELINKRANVGVFLKSTPITIGGALIETSEPDAQYNCTPCKIKKIRDLDILKYIILKDIVAFNKKVNNKYILVGHWAVDTIQYLYNKEAKIGEDYISSAGYKKLPTAYKKMVGSEGAIINSEKIQIISSNGQAVDIAIIMSLLSKYTKFKLSYRQQNPYIPNDFRVNRVTIYIKMPSIGNKIVEKPVIDIFNSGSFEMIPYVEKPFKDKMIYIGNMFVIMRFFMIDLWVLRIVLKLGLLTRSIFEEKMRHILHDVKKVRDPNLKWLTYSFGLDYIGYYDDYVVAKKIENVKNFAPPPYYPEKKILKKT